MATLSDDLWKVRVARHQRDRGTALRPTGASAGHLRDPQGLRGLSRAAYATGSVLTGLRSSTNVFLEIRCAADLRPVGIRGAECPQPCACAASRARSAQPRPSRVRWPRRARFFKFHTVKSLLDRACASALLGPRGADTQCHATLATSATTHPAAWCLVTATAARAWPLSTPPTPC
jgi:hypothetical protein